MNGTVPDKILKEWLDTSYDLAESSCKKSKNGSVTLTSLIGLTCTTTQLRYIFFEADSRKLNAFTQGEIRIEAIS